MNRHQKSQDSSNTPPLAMPQRQLSLRATLLGMLLGVPFAVANLYTLLHIGWSFGVNITACLIGFAVWRVVRLLSGNRVSPLGEWESVSLQATASAAGYATGATAAIAFGAMLLLTGRHPAPLTMFLVTILTGILGVLLAIPLRAWLIDAEQLPFPSGVMTATTIRGIAARTAEALRSARILLGSLVIGLVLGTARAAQTLLDSGAVSERWKGVLSRLTAPWLQESAFRYPFRASGSTTPFVVNGFGFDPSFLLIGAGMIVGSRIAFSMLLSALVLYVGIFPYLTTLTDIDGAPALGPNPDGSFEVRRWAVWPGTVLLLASALTGLLLETPRLARALFAHRADRTASDAGLRGDAPPLGWAMAGIPVVAIALGAVMSLGLGVPILGVGVAVVLAAFSAVLAARVTGETDNTPTGPVTKLAQAGAALVIRNDLTSNVLCGGVAGGAAMSAADLLQDMKTGRLLGANLRKLFFAQILGALVGAATIVPVWFALFPTAKSIEDASPIPIMISATAARVFAEGVSSIPVSARWATLWAAAIGIVLTVLARAVPRARGWLPSAVGLGMGWIFPFSNTLAFALGALIAAIWTLTRPRSAEADQTATASGLVAGESLMGACAALILAAIAASTMVGAGASTAPSP